ncbi:TPA: redox-regulated ATPase YchF, partial [Patescibacteria group bacterium]|nr:redox-regulated ATPase YchF [Patescibacteria group bacterium]
KSTLFNALLGANQAAASNFPFCTIEPNTGVVPVPDPRLSKLAELEHSQKIVPATVEFVDIAGLVRGASKGEGLGNQFLSHIRETEATIQVVRLFADSNVTHVSGQIDPLDDIAVINTELALADLQTLEKRLPQEEKAARGDAKLQPKVDFLIRLKKYLEAGEPARSFAVAPAETDYLHELQLLTAKPVLYVANVDQNQLQNNALLEPLRELAQKENSEVIAIDAKSEAELTELPEADRAEFLHSLGLIEPGLNQIIRAGYKLLGLITFFTAGEKETRGWMVGRGATAPQAAGVIHTDFEHGFIRAETVSYNDFIQSGGWAGAKAAGKVRSEGKTYVVQDGDVLLFRFNV